jgi:hypothetical protein
MPDLDLIKQAEQGCTMGAQAVFCGSRWPTTPQPQPQPSPLSGEGLGGGSPPISTADPWCWFSFPLTS